MAGVVRKRWSPAPSKGYAMTSSSSARSTPTTPHAPAWSRPASVAALVAIVRRKHWRAVLVYAAAYALLLAWSGSISASNDKNWAADVVHGITGIVDGDRVSVSNVRNFSWRTETDYTEGWEQRTYDLSKLRSLDLLLVYWMGPSIAHTIMSFGFD